MLTKSFGTGQEMKYRQEEEKMTPEHRDEAGIVWFWDDEMGIEKTPHGTGSHFVEPEDYKRVQLNWESRWDNGKLGTWIGWVDPPEVVQYGRNVRYEYVIWDETGHISGIHKNNLIPLKD